MKKLLFIFILFITSCGYQPIYISQNQDDFIFKKITLSGERQINKTIINALAIKEKSTLNSNKELFLQTDLRIEKTSKNSKGQITSYRSTVTVNNLDNKFDLTEYQNEIKKDIINKIIEEIIIYMNL